MQQTWFPANVLSVSLNNNLQNATNLVSSKGVCGLHYVHCAR